MVKLYIVIWKGQGTMMRYHRGNGQFLRQRLQRDSPVTRRALLIACWFTFLLAPLLAACNGQSGARNAGMPSSPSAIRESPSASPLSVAGSPPARVTSGVSSPGGTPCPTPIATATPANTRTGTLSRVAYTSSPRANLLHYQGRTYTNIGYRLSGTPAADPTLRLDRQVGKTFSPWQCNGSCAAGTEIYSVSGLSTEQMLALKGEQGASSFYWAGSAVNILDQIQVVQGTVKSFGPARWTTPDGQRPLPGCNVQGSAYTPATILLERVLQGRIPASEREIEVRQWGSVERQLGPQATGALEPVPLAPGTEVILFLYPGQWSNKGRGIADSSPGYAYWLWPDYAPPGNYYWLWPGWSEIVQGGYVLRFGRPDHPVANIRLEDFLVALAEVFRGVAPLDPNGVRPTPLPYAAKTPSPAVTAGQEVNLAQRSGADSVAHRFALL